MSVNLPLNGDLRLLGQCITYIMSDKATLRYFALVSLPNRLVEKRIAWAVLFMLPDK